MAIKRVLIANRGEIAVRVIRAARSMGIETVQAVSAADQESMPAKMADRAVVIGPAPAGKSYLRPELVVQAAISCGCDALHPGYGFLSERPQLAQMAEENGVTFVGPRADTIRALGDKLEAREIAESAGVPLVPGSDKIADVSAAKAQAEEIGYPLVIKAAAGGGGRGMSIVRSSEELERSFDRLSAEAKEAFGDATMYLERFVENARHVEVQVVGDGEGRVIHFGERDCSVQRRYQKLIEEAPCTVMPQKVRDKLHKRAVDLLQSLSYRGAGTVEFLYDTDRDECYFIEVNTRIQVEHPVTEEITGYDLVQLQFEVAGGEGLNVAQEEVAFKGHAIECRINAEDPTANFVPKPGRIEKWQAPEGAGIRIDTHCTSGYQVPPFYDSMLAKLIVYGDDRAAAVEKTEAALAEFAIEGQTTNLALLRDIAKHTDFTENAINTKWLEDQFLPNWSESQKG